MAFSTLNSLSWQPIKLKIPIDGSDLQVSLILCPSFYTHFLMSLGSGALDVKMIAISPDRELHFSS